MGPPSNVRQFVPEYERFRRRRFWVKYDPEALDVVLLIGEQPKQFCPTMSMEPEVGRTVGRTDRPTDPRQLKRAGADRVARRAGRRGYAPAVCHQPVRGPGIVHPVHETPGIGTVYDRRIVI